MAAADAAAIEESAPRAEHPQVYIPVDVLLCSGCRLVHFSVHAARPIRLGESFHESFQLAFHLSVHQNGRLRGEIDPSGRWRNRFIDGFTEPRNPTRDPRGDDPCVSARSARRKRAHAFPHVRGGTASGRIATRPRASNSIRRPPAIRRPGWSVARLSGGCTWRRSPGR
jgi:hypothetical protein